MTNAYFVNDDVDLKQRRKKKKNEQNLVELGH